MKCLFDTNNYQWIDNYHQTAEYANMKENNIKKKM